MSHYTQFYVLLLRIKSPSLRTTWVSRTVQEMGFWLCAHLQTHDQEQEEPVFSRHVIRLCTHHLDIVDCLLLELLEGPLGLGLQGEGQALKGLVLAFHTDLSLHLGVRQP